MDKTTRNQAIEAIILQKLAGFAHLYVSQHDIEETVSLYSKSLPNFHRDVLLGAYEIVCVAQRPNAPALLKSYSLTIEQVNCEQAVYNHVVPLVNQLDYSHREELRSLLGVPNPHKNAESLSAFYDKACEFFHTQWRNLWTVKQDDTEEAISTKQKEIDGELAIYTDPVDLWVRHKVDIQSSQEDIKWFLKDGCFRFQDEIIDIYCEGGANLYRVDGSLFVDVNDDVGEQITYYYPESARAEQLQIVWTPQGISFRWKEVRLPSNE